MQFPTTSSPFTPASNTVNRVMLQVLIALLPAIGIMFWLFGNTLLIQLLLSCSTALLAESCILWLRKKPIRMHLLDLSALVSAVLLALAIPTVAPWWIIVRPNNMATGICQLMTLRCNSHKPPSK
jgi:electron transport complex protein RnfD